MGVSLFSPAKINLYLGVTGRRDDGYHDLVSVAAPLDFGDQLEAVSREPEAGGRFRLTCDQPEVPVDETNLVLKAARAFADATGWPGGADFRLTKRIPLGAGLGGGSSNAVAALQALNQLSGINLPDAKLSGLASSLGSDCALFLAGAPVVMRGRGERVEPLPAKAAGRLQGRRILLFKPGFSIGTPWAYARMAAGASGHYRDAAAAEAQLSAWLGSTASAEELLSNDLEEVAFEKFIALPVLLAKLRREFGLVGRMSGSGSACFVLLREDADPAPLVERIRECWGARAFVHAARLA